MITGTIAFTVGVLLLQLQETLLDPLWLALLLPLAAIFWWLPRVRVATAVALGFFWALLHAHWTLIYFLPAELEGLDVTAVGTVISLPVVTDDHSRFEFAIERLSVDDKQYPSPGKVRLSWYHNPSVLIPGEQWQFLVRLKQPHGFMNPGGFDYEEWLFRNGIRATGYIRTSPFNRQITASPPGYWLQRLRLKIAARIQQSTWDPEVAGLLKALVIGDRSGLSADAWELFRRTGTSHLIAISGLHIGIVAGLAYLLWGRLWRCSERCLLFLPAPQAGALAALFAGAVYAALAGFSVPTQRALIMLTIGLGANLSKRELQPSRSLFSALLAVLIIDPFAVLSPGFWLSFIAVGVIILGISGRVGRPGVIRAWGGAQWSIAIGLSPLLLVWQGEIPLLAPFINLLAVPLFSLLLIPLVLTATTISLVWEPVGIAMLNLAGSALDLLRQLLTAVPALPLRLTGVANEIPGYAWIAAVIGVLLLLSPGGVPGRWSGMAMLMPLLWYPPERPGPGAVWFDLLDVGQGLSAVVRTRNHLLIYDTGPRFSDSFDAGTAVLLPFLGVRNEEQVDMVVLSNGDSDHQGGFSSLQRHIPIDRVLSGEPARVNNPQAQQCRAGMEWQWDGVRFLILHPGDEMEWQGNDASCVLLIESAAGRILITGDIEAVAERALLKAGRKRLKADLLLVPHHGSLSSSGTGLVAAVAPDYALVPSGYRNRYGFPKSEVVDRWSGQGACVLDTAWSGNIGFRLVPGHGVSEPSRYRYTHQRYWTARSVVEKCME
jgi:competence protein ComEC